MPSFLYHYTNLESLELILKSQTIKFGRLDRMNDVNEGKSADRGNLGMYVFASCWTAEDKDNLALWNMYSEGMQGVRIGMPIDMFETYPIESEPEKAFYVEKGTRCLVPRNEIHGSNYTAGLIPREFLVAMNYTDEEKYYIPQVSNNYDHIDFGRIGIFKRSEWHYEREWRYRFWVAPAPPPPERTYLEYKDTYDILTQQSFDRRIVEKEAFFLRIKNSAFSNMVVMTGPKQSSKQKCITKQLVYDLNPDACLVTSRMENELR